MPTKYDPAAHSYPKGSFAEALQRNSIRRCSAPNCTRWRTAASSYCPQHREHRHRHGSATRKLPGVRDLQRYSSRCKVTINRNHGNPAVQAAEAYIASYVERCCHSVDTGVGTAFDKIVTSYHLHGYGPRDILAGIVAAYVLLQLDKFQPSDLDQEVALVAKAAFCQPFRLSSDGLRMRSKTRASFKLMLLDALVPVTNALAKATVDDLTAPSVDETLKGLMREQPIK